MNMRIRTWDVRFDHNINYIFCFYDLYVGLKITAFLIFV